ncbi:Alpha/beta hydrolase family protein, partial [Durusdinium trenchii]
MSAAPADPGVKSVGPLHPAESSCSVVRVFYGTNRSETPGAFDTEEFYGSERGPLSFGSCEVSIPDRHEFGEVERPSIWTLDFVEDEDRHIVLQSVTPTDRDAFLNDLAREVDRSESHEAFVFIHGFNVSFAEAARRCAQMAYDLKFDGPPILYSWPSQGRLSEYVADMSAADASEGPLQEFMQAVAQESKARRIHVIAHSMGNRLLTNTLARIADSSPAQTPNFFNEVILAAPDVDAEVFRRDIAPRIIRASERVTIYSAEDDLALAASSR